MFDFAWWQWVLVGVGVYVMYLVVLVPYAIFIQEDLYEILEEKIGVKWTHRLLDWISIPFDLLIKVLMCMPGAPPRSVIS